MDLVKTKKIKKDKISSPPLAMEVDLISSKRIHYVGRGLPFQAKFIGQCEVEGQRGDELCVDAMAKLKAQIHSTRQHKKRIEILLQWNYIQVLEEKTSDFLHSHEISQISFVWKDPTDNRALGMIVVQTDAETKLTKNMFFAYKTKDWALMVMTEIQKLFEEKAKDKEEIENKPISDCNQESEFPGNERNVEENDKDNCVVVNLLDLTVEDKTVETTSVDPWTGTASQFQPPPSQMVADVFHCDFSFPPNDLSKMTHNDLLLNEIDPFPGKTIIDTTVTTSHLSGNPSNPFIQSTTCNLNPFVQQDLMPAAIATFDKTDSIQLSTTSIKNNNNKINDPFSDLISIELLNVQQKEKPKIQEKVKKPSLLDLKREQLAANLMQNSDDFHGGQNFIF